MQLKGEVLIRICDKYGRQTKPDIREGNLIYDSTLLDILSSSPGPVFNGIGFLGYGAANISISGQSTPPLKSDNILTDIIATGSIPSGVVSPIWFEDVEPNFGQIVNEFPAAGFSRTFDSVGLTTRVSNNDEGGISDEALTTVLLSISCTQLPTEILSIFYFIKLFNTNRKYFTSRFIKDFGGSLFAIKNCNLNNRYFSFCTPPTNDYIDYFVDNSTAYDLVLIPPPLWDSSTRIDSHFKWKNTREWTIQNSGIPGQVDQEIGRIFNSFLIGTSNTYQPQEVITTNTSYVKGSNTEEGVNSAYRMQRYNPKQIAISNDLTAKIPPFQPMWGHRPGSEKPFFDTLFKERGTGGIKLSGTWVVDLPKMYKIIITTTGNKSTARYRLQARSHLGFAGNNWINRANGFPFINYKTPCFVGQHGYKLDNNDYLKVSSTRVLIYDETGITLLSLLNGNYVNYDKDSTPALNCTNIRQCAVDTENQLIYVGCRNSGLFVVDVDANTITSISTSPCYGVDIGFNNVVYAIFNGGLRRSTDWSITLPIDYTGLTDGNWEKSYYLKANPSNSDIQIAIIIESTTPNYRKIIWYQATSETTIEGYEDSTVERYAASFDCSDTGDLWADVFGYNYTFGEATFGYLGNPAPHLIGYQHTTWGNIFYYGKVTFYKDLFVAIDGLRNLFTVLAYDVNLPSNLLTPSHTTLHVTEGIIFQGNLIYCVLPEASSWIDYGWDGINWIAGSTSDKLADSTAQALIDGLTIEFTNGLNEPSFVANDFYNQSLNEGTLKDNSIAIYYESYWYTKKVNFDTPIDLEISSATIVLPEKSNIFWVRIEDDSIDLLSQFLIDGVEVIAVWLDSTSPNLGEVTIDAIAGTLTFNTGDIGKQLTGYYAWIEDD